LETEKKKKINKTNQHPAMAIMSKRRFDKSLSIENNYNEENKTRKEYGKNLNQK
jgi:hypothetical protein